MKVLEKEAARKLRKKGLSINQIVAETGCSKASVSEWVRDVVLTKNQKKKITERGRSVESVEKRRLSRLRNEQAKRDSVVEEAKKSIQSVSQYDLKLIGTMIYLGEGAKTQRGSATVANSDPAVIQIVMRFFREVCGVSEDKFHAHIHTFDNADVEKTERYWSRVTGIPRKQFYKTYVKQSIATLHKRRTIPY